MHWLIGIGGLILWLFLGAVFGSHGEKIRTTIKSACTSVSDWLRDGATAMLSWARWCFTNIERFARWLGDRLPKWEDEPSTPALASAPASANDASELNPTITALAGVALVCAIALNGYLLYDITPGLFSFSPNDLKHGAGRFISWLVPLTILAFEVIGGLLVKSEQRRLAGGNKSASTRIAWIVFLFAYAVELAAGIRRAVSFLESASPFADETTHITWDSAATAGLWAILAAGIPWGIFLLSRYIEPALNRSDAARQVTRFVGQLVRFVAVLLAVVSAVIGVSLILGFGGLITGLAGGTTHVLSGAIRYLVYGVLFAIVIALIDMSGMAVDWFRGWRGRTPPPAAGTSAAALVLIALLGACGRSNATAPRTDRKFATVLASDLRPAPNPEVFEDVADAELPRYIGEQHKVVQVLEPQLHVCLADVTASVAPDLRRSLLRQCAEFVSALTSDQGPETTGVVVPIVDAALTSKLLTVQLDGADAPVRCTTNPPIPEFPSRSTVTDARMKSIRASYQRAERDCTAVVGRGYAMASRTRQERRAEFVSRVIRELGDRVYARTDILGALGYVAEFVRRQRADRGQGLTVQITIISDLEDDANGCRYASGKVTCPQAPIRAARLLLQDKHTRLQLQQVLQSTLASRRGSAYVQEKAAVEARQEAWREFWVSFAPDHVKPFTFTAPASRRVATSPPQSDPGTVSSPGGADTDVSAPTCAYAALLRSKHEAVDAQTLSAADWLSYGRALAACGPRTRPWEALGVGSRERFFDRYVLPFVNGDAAQGSLFQTQEPTAYKRIIHDWKISG